MKDLVIAEFEKPTKCEDCPCFYKTEGAFNDECQLTHKEIENYFIIDKSCPLKGGKVKMEKYCDTNLNYYIKVKLTEEGRIIYKKHYAKYNCEAPKLNIDDEGYVQFQIHDFMNIFGERLFMGATLPCETNCKIQVKDEWHYPSKGEYPDENKLVLIYAKNEEGYGHDFMTYHKDNGWYGYGTYIEEVIAWKELDIPKDSE